MILLRSKSSFGLCMWQHNFPPDFPSPKVATELIAGLLARADIYSVVVEVDGKVAGSNFLWEGDEIAGVGPITVDPEVQNDGLGHRLMGDILRLRRQISKPATDCAAEFTGTTGQTNCWGHSIKARLQLWSATAPLPGMPP